MVREILFSNVIFQILLCQVFNQLESIINGTLQIEKLDKIFDDGKLYLFIISRVKNSRSLHRTFNVEPLYLQHENTGLAIDYMVRMMRHETCCDNE